MTDSSNPRDPELRRQLGALGGHEPDVTAAYAAVNTKVRRVRRVRAAVFSACGVFMVGGVAAAGIGSRDSGTVAPAATSADTSVDTSDPTTTEASTSPAVTTVVAPDTSAATSSSDAPTSSADTTEPGASLPPNTSVTPTPDNSTFSGVGGAVVVRAAGNGLELVSSSPAAGFSQDIRSAGGDKVEVRFRSDSHRTTIKVRLRNGVLSPEIDEKAEGSDDDGNNSGGGSDDSKPENTTPRTDDDDDNSGSGGGDGDGDDSGSGSGRGDGDSRGSNDD